MLIFNSKKEFVGIDENDLHRLGFSDFSQIKEQADDFADMFVKEPGYIYNFQHVSWIDFILCSDQNDIHKVIIKTDKQEFKSNIEIKTAYLSDEPSSKAFIVNLNNLRELINNVEHEISIDPEILTAQVSHTKNIKDDIIEDEIEQQIESVDYETPIAQTSQDEISVNIDETDIKIDSEESEEPLIDLDDTEKDIVEDTVEAEIIKLELFDNGYIYDPQVASDDLGLPIDLVNEFIEDFIAQAKEFKEKLYSNLYDGNEGEVKALSHKLKGVAANLRIEDAFEALVIINTSNDNDEILKYLDLFYKIISKLAGEKIPVKENKTSAVTQTNSNSNSNEDDGITLEFKDENEDDKPEIELEQTTQELHEDDEITIEFKDEDYTPKVEIKNTAPELNGEDEIVIEFKDEVYIPKTEAQKRVPELNEDDEISIDFDIEEKQSKDSASKIESITYDKHNIANEIGIDYENFLELFNDYISEAYNIIDSIHTSIKAEDSKDWQNKAKQLKSMNDNMRIDSFNEELDTLIKTTDSGIANIYTDKIKATITKIRDLED